MKSIQMALVFRKVVAMKSKRRKKGQKKKTRVSTKVRRVMRVRTEKGVYFRRVIKSLERT